MSWFANLKLLPKLMLAFSLVLALTTALGLFAKHQLSVVNEASTDISSNWMPSIEAIGRVNAAIDDVRMAALSHTLVSDDPGKRAMEADLKRAIDQLAKSQDNYSKLISSPQEQATYDAFKAQWAAYVAVQNQVLQLSSIGETEQARHMALGKGREAFDQAAVVLDKLIALNHDGGVGASTAANDIYQMASWSILAAIVVTVALGLGLAFGMGRAIAGPVKLVVAVLDSVSQGDLTQKVRHDRGDELGDMQLALGHMIDGLSTMVSEVRAGADSVATASSQIAQGNRDLSGRTEEQASSLEETAASIEEMSGTVRTNADNARQANQLASAASTVATRGGEVVTQVIGTMNDIQAASRKISDIIGVIDGIAFQTNILALNAAVEAARAGEQGRGFAVVAGEVRSLAQRSAQAAREIKTLISDSVERVDAGSQLVGTAGSTMTDVVTQVRKVTDLVGEIAHASTEQSQGIGQINQAVSQLDQMTQQNAALVEESMAAAESLKVQAQRLTQAVGVFRTGHSLDAEVKAKEVIGALQRKTTHAAGHTTPVKPLGKTVHGQAPQARTTSTPVKAIKPAAQPQLPSPATAAAHTTASAGKDDDWETF